jgi:hypothetical protein
MRRAYTATTVVRHERRETTHHNHGKLLVQVFIAQNEDQLPLAFDFDGSAAQVDGGSITGDRWQ